MTTDTGSTPTFPTRLYHCLRADDAPALIDWLVAALGLSVDVRYDGEDGAVDHCQLSWPGGGAVMLGSARDSGAPGAPRVGVASAFLVTDDVDAALARARAACAEIVEDLHDTDYGDRTFTARDPEGNTWVVGIYPGGPASAH